MALILGLDPGVAIMGYGLVKDSSDGAEVLAYGALSTSPDVPIPQRLKELYYGLSLLIERHQPQEVAIELFIARNLRTALAVGQARGIALLAAANNNLPIYDYTPLQVKQQVCGYGRGDKRQIQKMVQIQLGLSSVPQPDDAADALAIALCHIRETHLKKLISKEVKNS
jgi:crossover junction endodeoxyribonuclease RuvC